MDRIVIKSRYQITMEPWGRWNNYASSQLIWKKIVVSNFKGFVFKTREGTINTVRVIFMYFPMSERILETYNKKKNTTKKLSIPSI